MPELPEVETTRRGIEPHILDQRIVDVRVRERRLRWPVPDDIDSQLNGHEVTSVGRRAKYLLLEVGAGHLIIHLGMSGSLRILDADVPPDTHDHVDILFDSGQLLRYNDPRRFGSMHFTTDPIYEHWLLSELGPEPMDEVFTGKLLHTLSRGRKGAVKNFIMHQSVVVGVGNIYASESLFRAGIHPSRPAGKVSLERYESLVETIQETLGNAIEAGGTTLRDFTGSDGSPGYFALALNVYGREGEPCPVCEKPVRKRVIGQRSTFYCTTCQR